MRKENKCMRWVADVVRLISPPMLVRLWPRRLSPKRNGQDHPAKHHGNTRLCAKAMCAWSRRESDDGVHTNTQAATTRAVRAPHQTVDLLNNSETVIQRPFRRGPRRRRSRATYITPLSSKSRNGRRGTRDTRFVATMDRHTTTANQLRGSSHQHQFNNVHDSNRHLLGYVCLGQTIPAHAMPHHDAIVLSYGGGVAEGVCHKWKCGSSRSKRMDRRAESQCDVCTFVHIYTNDTEIQYKYIYSAACKMPFLQRVRMCGRPKSDKYIRVYIQKTPFTTIG